MATVTYRKTITEQQTGLREDPASPTGWFRMAGLQEQFVEIQPRGGKRTGAPLYRKVSVPQWVPVDPPQTRDYAEAKQHGVVRGEVKAIIDVQAPPRGQRVVLSPAQIECALKALINTMGHTFPNVYDIQDADERAEQQRLVDSTMMALGLDPAEAHRYDG